ncbi:MAG: non-canonical purine NTP pyrophosphatase, partial [Proteobacteria bacterium]|nr:non-canonical purine NTP pyrophosphatase [Pseudomonadota bacterium]
LQDHIRNPEKLSLVETSDHYYDNAIAKARTCNHGCHYPSLADDSGLEVDFLGGKPGVRSHRFAIPKAGETQDVANVKKLLEALKGVPAEQRGARFVCHLALVMEGKLVHVVGTLEGSIATEPSGSDGFGYDPVFIPKGQTKTLAELGTEVKNKISHRAQAVSHLMEQLKLQEVVLAKP